MSKMLYQFVYKRWDFLKEMWKEMELLEATEENETKVIGFIILGPWKSIYMWVNNLILDHPDGQMEWDNLFKLLFICYNYEISIKQIQSVEEIWSESWMSQLGSATQQVLLYTAWWITHVTLGITASFEPSRRVTHLVNNPKLNYSTIFSNNFTRY